MSAGLPYDTDVIRGVDLASILKAKKWRLIFITVTVILAGGAIYPFLPRTYSGVALLYIQPTEGNGQQIFGHSIMSAFDESQIDAFTDILGSPPTMQAVIKTQHLLEDAEFNPTPTDDWYMRFRTWLHAEPVDPEQAVETKLRKHLIIQRDRKSYVIQVGFWSRTPSLAAAMANTLAYAFVADQLAHRQTHQRELVARLEKSANELHARYENSEDATHAYLVQSGLIHKGEQTAVQQQLDALSVEYAKAILQSHAAERRMASLTEMQRAGTLESAPEVLESSIIRDLKERMITLTAGVGTITSQVGRGGASPESLADLQKSINVEMLRIVRSAQIESSMARLIAVSLKAEIMMLDARMVEWRDAERRLKSLQQVADVDLGAWRDAMNQARTQQNLISMLRPDVTVYSIAETPATPSFPNAKLYVGGTLILAVMFAGLSLVPAISTVSSRAKYVQ